jgi:hypothetical protein
MYWQGLVKWVGVGWGGLVRWLARLDSASVLTDCLAQHSGSVGKQGVVTVADQGAVPQNNYALEDTNSVFIKRNLME